MSQTLNLPIKVYQGMGSRNVVCILFFLAIVAPSAFWWKQSINEPHLSFTAHLGWSFLVFLAIAWVPAALLMTEDFAEIVVNQKSLTITPVNIFWKPKKAPVIRSMDEFDFIDLQITYSRGGPSCFIIFHAKPGNENIRIDAPDDTIPTGFSGNRNVALRDYAARLGILLNLRVKQDA